MWGWIFVFLSLALLLYIDYLKRELRNLKYKVREIPGSSGFGRKLFLDFREKALLELVDELNQMIDAYESKIRHARQMEENVKLSIAGLSHDLRTPLTSIHGYIQLLQMATEETKKAQYLEVIADSVQRLMDMADQFYDLTRIETNQKEIALSSISLSKRVEEIFLSFHEQLEKKNIELQFPDQTKDRPVIADSLLLNRVLQNIVQNILRYAKSKAVISYASGEGDLICSIKNDIRPESKVAIEKVFTMFYTEVASRTNTESSGLGLYLSKKLVEKMNGKLDAKLHDHWFILEIRLPVNRVQT